VGNLIGSAFLIMIAPYADRVLDFWMLVSPLV
jgi:hypothetical protein